MVTTNQVTPGNGCPVNPVDQVRLCRSNMIQLSNRTIGQQLDIEIAHQMISNHFNLYQTSVRSRFGVMAAYTSAGNMSFEALALVERGRPKTGGFGGWVGSVSSHMVRNEELRRRAERHRNSTLPCCRCMIEDPMRWFQC